MSEYYFDKEKFVIENYLEKSAFSNFLPGVAGKKGIPLWAFYVNRGQGISGFGLQDKNHPIMEFTPANKAYESVGAIGFRTVLKVNGTYYEPFLPQSKNKHRMLIDRHSFAIEETNRKQGVKVEITYFGLPNENIGALVRRVKVSNISKSKLSLELLDGLAEILPAGVENGNFKQMSNLLVSWMDVEELENEFAFYNLRSSTGDSSEVSKVSNGNYLFGLLDGKLITPIVDQDLVFGLDNSKRSANNFEKQSIDEIIKADQVTVNKIPCGFIPIKKDLEANNSFEFDIIIGYTNTKELLYRFINKASTPGYLDKKQEEAKQLIDEIVNDVSTDTASHIFNEYIKQNYLDNLLRGGYPYKIGNSIYHLFSRRHGDLERDYNFFSLAPEFYSQGSGNFRDVCQNRRLDSFIHPEVGAHNLKHFAALIQLDGYNPLTIGGLTYSIEDKDLLRSLVEKHFKEKKEEIYKFLSNRFSPGGLVNYLANLGIESDESAYLDAIIANADSHIESAYGEGYWIDHFTYIIDLSETFEAIYPDKVREILFKQNDILTFDSPVTVLGKLDKTVIDKQGKVRQYGSLLHFDEDKIERLNMNRYGSNWVKSGSKAYKTNVFNKLFILVLNKHSQLDNEGLGVEMEAERPGWNDAMNGLPGLFGSGISETIELKRIVKFLLKHLDKDEIELPNEVFEFFNGLFQAKNYSDRVNLRENYREKVRFGLSGKQISVNYLDVSHYLEELDKYITKKIDELYIENDKIIPTYVVYDVLEHQEIVENGKSVIGHYRLPLTNPISYEKRYLPKFLEAPARLLKTDFNKEKLREMYQAIKKSGMHDEALGIYKTSEALEKEDFEIGRIRAFTEGWLERESDFLHMIYKYVIGLLKAGLYEEFFIEMEKNFVCFMNPEVYGRNILENSSFIAPSNNPNPAYHGKGFLPRLSGSTVEVLDIWRLMMIGEQPFRLKGNKVIFKPEPILTKEFFKEDGTLSFTFLKGTKVTYINPNKKDTFQNARINKIELINDEGKETFYQDFIDTNQAVKIRDNFYKNIKIYII